MNVLENIVESIEIFETMYKVPYVVGGTTALYIYGLVDREPADIDLMIDLPKDEFLLVYKGTEIPNSPYKFDWHFNYDHEVLEVRVLGKIIKLDSPRNALMSKFDFLLDDKLESKSKKHKEDLEYLMVPTLALVKDYFSTRDKRLFNDLLTSI